MHWGTCWETATEGTFAGCTGGEKSEFHWLTPIQTLSPPWAAWPSSPVQAASPVRDTKVTVKPLCMTGMRSRVPCCGHTTFSRAHLPVLVARRLPTCQYPAQSIPIYCATKPTWGQTYFKCQPSLFGLWMRNARVSENAMFGLDFFLECRMEHKLDPPRVLRGLKE